MELLCEIGGKSDVNKEIFRSGLVREEEASFISLTKKHNLFPGFVLVKVNGSILSVFYIGVVGIFGVVIRDKGVFESLDDIIHEELNLAIGPVLDHLFGQQQISGFVEIMDVFVNDELSICFIGPSQGLNDVIADVQFVLWNF